jgi:hypothetical protein
MNKASRVVSMLSLALLLPFAATTVGAQGAESAAKPVRPKHLIRGDYSFRLTPATSFAPWYDGTNGKDSGVIAAPRQDVLRVGVLSVDAKGGVSGHTIATTDDGLTTVVIDFTFSGTYTLNDDGTGTLSIGTVNVTDASCAPAQAASACATFEGPETYAFVVNNHGEEKSLDLIETDNEGGGAKIFLTGEAKRR